MQVKYDESVNALYVYFTDEPVARTERAGEHANVDYDSENRVVGIEILDPTDGVNLDGLPRSEDIGRILTLLRFPVFA